MSQSQSRTESREREERAREEEVQGVKALFPALVEGHSEADMKG